MNAIVNRFAPTITDMIRMDHAHVLNLFHQYEKQAGQRTRQALVASICLNLEIHTKLEEEIFYPALRAAGGSNPVLDKSEPEHASIRHLIDSLRAMDAGDADFDDTLMQMMREVMHHVADEETTLLPEAERLLKDQLHELGAQMTRRRMQLSAPHAGEIAVNTMRTMPASSMLVAAGALLAGTYFVRRSLGRPPRRLP